MINPYDEESNKPRSASYDVRIGDEYRFSHEKRVRKLSKWKKQIKIPPHSLCYILSKEELNLPKDVSALIFSMHEVVKQGILMYPQPPIDPGFRGKLYLLLHNLTNKTRVVEKDDRIASLVFDKLTEEPEKPYDEIEDNKFHNKQTLEQMGLGKEEDFDPYSSALKTLSDMIQRVRTEIISRWIPIFLIIVTVLLMVLSVLFGIKGC
jgi:deoxycytidine triphosphate deaminase